MTERKIRVLVAKPGLDGHERGAKVIDRKSTRLNSSHDQISYAVFCLKKKKKNNHRTMLLGNHQTPILVTSQHSADLKILCTAVKVRHQGADGPDGTLDRVPDSDAHVT